MTKHNIRFVVYRYRHHSPHSGYSRLAEYGSHYFNGKVIRVDKPISKTIIRNRIFWRLIKGTPGYTRSAMATELKVAWQMLNEKNCIYHFLYGETTYHYAGQFKDFRQNHVVATFHLPPDGIREAIGIHWHIQQLSAVVCVGRSQQEYFSDIYDKDRVFFVPLGIDTEYYTPPNPEHARDPNLCLIVGENYRDFPTLRGVIELVSYLRPETKFVVLTSPQSYPLIGNHPNLSLRSNISETELMDLYRSAALMFMPLLDATANNALLESMACGLPVIVSDVGSIRDYVGTDSAILVPPGNARGMAECVLDLLADESERKIRAEKSREQAEKFSWMEVMKQIEAVYNTIA